MINLTEEQKRKVKFEILNYLLTKSQENLIKNGSVDTGMLVKSGNIDTSSMKLIYSSPYAEYVEFGTSPHYVSAKHLFSWAERKLGDKKLAYAIAKKIEREGTQPQPFIRPAIQQAKEYFKNHKVMLK